MPDEQGTSQSATSDQTTVWLVLATGRPDGAGAAFWEWADAAAHAEVLSVTNPGGRAVLREVVVQGERRRCRLCDEPVVLDDPTDPMSWIHAADANDLGDHTAEV